MLFLTTRIEKDYIFHKSLDLKTIQKVDILAVGAHPDDVELGCAGTLVKHQQMGMKIGIVDLTQGELGTRGDALSREREAMESAAILNLGFRVNLGLADGFFEVDEGALLSLIRVIRLARPSIVLANAVMDRHPDHAKGAELVRRACFLSGLPKVHVADTHGNSLPKHRPNSVFHYIQDYNLKPDFVVNIDAYWEVKMKAVMAFKTQFYEPNMVGDASPISGKDFLDFLEGKARTYGRHIGAEFGEGFTSDKYLGIDDLRALT
jgi:N-acetylglucosamine malate deacetylase 1